MHHSRTFCRLLNTPLHRLLAESVTLISRVSMSQLDDFFLVLCPLVGESVFSLFFCFSFFHS